MLNEGPETAGCLSVGRVGLWASTVRPSVAAPDWNQEDVRARRRLRRFCQDGDSQEATPPVAARTPGTAGASTPQGPSSTRTICGPFDFQFDETADRRRLNWPTRSTNTPGKHSTFGSIGRSPPTTSSNASTASPSSGEHRVSSGRTTDSNSSPGRCVTGVV